MKRLIIWQSKKTSWCELYLHSGKRNSDVWQLFPIWNMSNNIYRSLYFGFYKWYISIEYQRAGTFNQDRNYPFRYKLWKFYQLIF